jgi:potassium-transporting ATPase KdpC subunit
MFRRDVLPALILTALAAVFLGLVYPMVIYGVGQVAFRSQANGSFVARNNQVIGSSLIGQNFLDAKGNPLPQYFQSRPSAAGKDGYDATSSSASNLGPGDPRLLKVVAQRVADYRKLNSVANTVAVPVDAVTASASGLDPNISIANADLQAPRVAHARNLLLSTVLALIKAHTTPRALGFLGEPGVNVLEVNLALDALHR